jgi:hypothetical protein
MKQSAVSVLILWLTLGFSSLRDVINGECEERLVRIMLGNKKKIVKSVQLEIYNLCC